MIQSMTALQEEATRRPRRTVAVAGAHHMDVLRAVAMARATADIVLKGFVDSAVLLRAALHKKSGLRIDTTVSHTVVMDIPGARHLNSRGDSADTKLNSIALGILLCSA